MTDNPNERPNIEDRLAAIEASVYRTEQIVSDILDILNDVYPEIDDTGNPYAEEGHVSQWITVPIKTDQKSPYGDFISKEALAKAIEEGKVKFESTWNNGHRTSLDIVPIQKQSLILAAPVLEVLEVVVQHSAYFAPNVKQLATLTGYSLAEPFKSFIKSLRDTGLIMVDSEQVITPTMKGYQMTEETTKIPFIEPQQAYDEWRKRIGNPQSAILDSMVDGPLDKTSTYMLKTLHKVAVGAGYDKNNPTFKNYLSKIKSNGLIEIVEGISARVTPALFMNLL